MVENFFELPGISSYSAPFDSLISIINKGYRDYATEVINCNTITEKKRAKEQEVRGNPSRSHFLRRIGDLEEKIAKVKLDNGRLKRTMMGE